METIYLLAYGFIQGICEFLPISSSAHLFIFEVLCNLPGTPEGLEAAINLGSLIAILLYFWRSIWKLLKGFFHAFQGRQTDERHLFFTLLLASLPALAIGLTLHLTNFRGFLQNIEILAWSTAVFGLLMLITDRAIERYHVSDITYREALLGWGIAQCLAFVSGISRSGILITFGRFMGYKRHETVFFAFLLAIPALKGASLLMGLSWLKGNPPEALLRDSYAFLFAAGTSLFAGLLTIHFFLKGLSKDWLQYLAFYRVFLGLGLIFSIYVMHWRPTF